MPRINIYFCTYPLAAKVCQAPNILRFNCLDRENTWGAACYVSWRKGQTHKAEGDLPPSQRNQRREQNKNQDIWLPLTRTGRAEIVSCSVTHRIPARFSLELGRTRPKPGAICPQEVSVERPGLPRHSERP